MPFESGNERNRPLEPGAGGELLAPFSPAVARWFAREFEHPSPIQRAAWPWLARAESVLLVAPTGSGKTLAAFLSAIDRLLALPPDAPKGVRILYVSPLKALVYDIERNLRGPLAGIQALARVDGPEKRAPRVDVRTGDTPARTRRAQLTAPAEVLATTPESLFLLLGSRARSNLAVVETIIVDEVHAMAGTKRGAHLALSLERLDELTRGARGTTANRIGLSATVADPGPVAKWLTGGRQCQVVAERARPHLSVTVRMPAAARPRVPFRTRRETADATPAPSETSSPETVPNTAPETCPDKIRDPDPARRSPRDEEATGVWPAIHRTLLEIVLSHRSTIVFVNNRGSCERLADALNELADEPLVLAHHGSIAHERRTAMEEALKGGRLRGIVATSSLELGIDMQHVDMVVLVESPGSVGRALQRVGRAGHRLGVPSAGILLPKFPGDSLECAVIAEKMLAGELEPLRPIEAPLDVLAQQVAAMCADTPRPFESLHRIATGATPYRALSAAALTSIIEMLSGHYPSTELADLTPLLSWDRVADLVSARRGTPLLLRLNAGTIPDRGLFGVFLSGERSRVGELDEEMVFETRPGDRIVLGATTWRVEAIETDRVLVSPAPGEPGRLPFWHGDAPGRPLALGKAIGAFVRDVTEVAPDGRARYIQQRAPLDRCAARQLADYLSEQCSRTGKAPSDRTVVVERFRDELGDWRVCILSPFGRSVHGPWAMALQRQLGAAAGFQCEITYGDDGIVLGFPDGETVPSWQRFFPDPETVEADVVEEIASTSLFATLFRENAARALLLPRRRPGRRAPLWAQRRKAAALLGAVRRYPDFAIVLETYRQVLVDLFDVPALAELLREIDRGTLSVLEVETDRPSPFARDLLHAHVARYLYEQDAPPPERRAQALALDPDLLASLLGEREARQAFDPETLEAVEAALQEVEPERLARDPDELHDRLRRLGDLTLEEVASRCRTDDPLPWLERLVGEGRAREIELGGVTRWITAGDGGWEPGLDGGFPSSPEALRDLVLRYARTHGPFEAATPARHWGVDCGRVRDTLEALAREGLVVLEPLVRGRPEPLWCHRDVLRRLKRAALESLRRILAPASPARYARFLCAWHRIGEGESILAGGRGNPRDPDRLLDAVERLEGFPAPWPVLREQVLPARLGRLDGQPLDVLSTTGRLVWAGAGGGPGREIRVALYRRERLGALLPDPPRAAEPPPAAGPQASHPGTHSGGGGGAPRSDHAPGTSGSRGNRALPGLAPGIAPGIAEESGSWEESARRNVLEQLAARGASFTFELEAPPGADIEAVLTDLVRGGLVTNDTFAPLSVPRRARRASAAGSRRHRRSRTQRPGTGFSGRWTLLSRLIPSPPNETERALARAEMLLARYGVVGRETVLSEGLPGGFAPVYRALEAMESRGLLQRGYFVEGLGGAQFADPRALELLRRHARPRPKQQFVLGAIDPANPYGATLPWPAPAAGDPLRAELRRTAGAWVVLSGGKLMLYAGRRARRMVQFDGHGEKTGGLAPGEDARESAITDTVVLLARAIRARTGHSIQIETIDGRPARHTFLGQALEGLGFLPDHRGRLQAPRR